MKRTQTIAAVVLGVVLLSVAMIASSSAPGPAVAIRALSLSTQAQGNGGMTVYLTKTGARYHRAGCSSLRRSSIPVTLREAVQRGYTPCANCRPPVLETGAPAPNSPRAQSSRKPPDQPKVAPDDNGDTIVYVTKTGAKYHRAGCRSLAKSQIPMKLRDAVAKGYTACAICKPPALTKK
jgi:methylphosphotriester-DNA--protein-cysteine methyltransferase